MKRSWILLPVLVISVAGIYLSSRNKPTLKPSPEAPLLDANRKYASKPTEAKTEYNAYITANDNNPDPAVQDHVGDARMHLAYLQAKDNNFDTARSTFIQAKTRYKGTGRMSADFGGIPDQAAYQAAVCLVAEHKNSEAKAEFLKIMKDRPLSPVVRACYNRLLRLNGGKTTDDWDNLLQHDQTAQEAFAKREMAMCGPKVLAYLLKQGLIHATDGKTKGYEELAKLCGTTNGGTSIEGLRKGLRTLGIESYAMEVNREDFGRLQTPFILLERDHYAPVLQLYRDYFVYYDTVYGENRTPLPLLDDTSFRATVITFQMPDFDMKGSVKGKAPVVTKPSKSSTVPIVRGANEDPKTKPPTPESLMPQDPGAAALNRIRKATAPTSNPMMPPN
jgi:hypothetical protein